MIWREKRILLVVLGILLAANTVFFFTYRVQYQRRLQSLEERKEQGEAQLTAARSARLGAERKVAALRQVQKDIDEVYTRHWSTQEERLVPFISEVTRLSVASELVPGTRSFQQTEKERDSAARAREVSITFAVRGNYQQVRRLINLLELSEQFVIIEQISLSSNESGLNFNLKLKTLFRDTTPVANRRS